MRPELWSAVLLTHHNTHVSDSTEYKNLLPLTSFSTKFCSLYPYRTMSKILIFGGEAAGLCASVSSVEWGQETHSLVLFCTHTVMQCGSLQSESDSADIGALGTHNKHGVVFQIPLITLLSRLFCEMICDDVRSPFQIIECFRSNCTLQAL